MKEEDLDKLITELLISESQLIFNTLEEHLESDIENHEGKEEDAASYLRC